MPKNGSCDIPLQEINSNVHSKRYSSSSSSSSEDDVQFEKTERRGSTPRVYRTPSICNQIEELPSVFVRVTVSDVVFNFVVFCVVCLSLVVDLCLVVLHYRGGDKMASGLTCLFLGFGGFGVLRRFWGVTYDQLDRIYTNSNCVRIVVNCFPWLGNVITTFQVTSCAIKSRSNPMVISRYVKLQELSQGFLLVQGFVQGAPQAVLQLVLLLEGLEGVGGLKASMLLTSITASLTIMMISNLPLKNERDECLKPAAYSPYARCWIGMRMVSSFGSRTLSTSLLFSTSRCITPILISSPSIITSHGIPFSIILIPRCIFTIADYIHTKISTRQTEPQPKKSCLKDIAVAYTATIFIVFSDPVWIFWYSSLESLSFVVFWIVGEVVSGGGCLGVGVGACVFGVFVLLFVIVPFCVPALKERIRGTGFGGVI